ncbi:MAG: hypothetical protein LBB94_12700, partial [Clostridiales bacterium]|nr:hypothetical protein [Clostridiales bacterium]
MNNKRKLLTVITAVSLSGLIISGTFAWASLNSSKINSWTGTGDNSNPLYGGTLHDDHIDNGENKDVYVENWGQNAIAVRLYLSEYMEIGQGAGTKNDPDVNRAVSIDIAHPDANINDPLSWTPHIIKSGDTQSTGLNGDVFREYWEWNMGGQKYYNPAPADKRGVPDADGIDYVDSSSPEDLSPSVSGVRRTLFAEKVITIDEWEQMTDSQQIGSYWVIDTEDGAAYWAAPLESGQATGLLIDRVVLKKKPVNAYYYGVNVQAQMCSLDSPDSSTVGQQSLAGPAPADNYEVFLATATEKGKKLIHRLLEASVSLPMSPTAIPQPEASTATPTPTVAPASTATPTPTIAPASTATPTPTVAPSSTATPTPTSAPTSTATPTPTVTPEPPPVAVQTVTINMFRPLEGEMSFRLTNVVRYDSEITNPNNEQLKASEIENGGTIIAKAPCVVTCLST